MSSFLVRLFVKNYNDTKNPKGRENYGTLAGFVGIFCNLILSALKIGVGFITGSLSISADGFNNLTDMGSSVVAMLGFKLAGKPADRDHPFGHARIEYVASMIVSFLVLLVEFELMTDSVGKIFNPEPTTYNALVIIILVASIAVKLWLFVFGRSAAKKISSEVVKAAATDSLSDAIATSAVLASIIICRVTDFDTDGYMGVIVAVIVMIAGIKILNETKNSILGSAPEPELIDEIVRITREYPEALGIHDMVVHNYGPGRCAVSLHAEVPSRADLIRSHDLIDCIEKEIMGKYNAAVCIHMDPVETDDPKVEELQKLVLSVLESVDPALSLHDFRVVFGETHTNLIFDLVVPFGFRMEGSLRDEVQRRIWEKDPQLFVVATVKHSYT